MKVSLIVASGTHQGKAIPINRPEFLIGREGFCHLRPASQAISKKHCGIVLREGKAFIVDYASTNGTLVNDVLLKNEEAELQDGAHVSIGPLDFTVRIEVEQGVTDGTPFPTAAPQALAAVKAVSSAAPAGQTRDSTPNPSIKPRGLFGSGSKEAAALTDSKEQAALTGSKEQAAVKPSGGSKPTMKPVPTPAKPAAALPTSPPPPPKRDTKISASAPPEGDSDDIAAMLLGMDDDEEVPGGSTVMEGPALLTPPPPADAAAKPEDKTPKKATSREDMTNAAADLLRKMARRPK